MKERILLEVMDYIKLIVIVVLITTILNTLLFTFSTVQQSSMEPTLHEGDVLIINKASYLFGRPAKGDIIVFVEEEAVSENYLTKLKVLFQDIVAKFTGETIRTRLVKRIIGMPGDEISIEDGNVFVNGIQLDERYVENLTFAKIVEYPIVVPEDHYFVMGDHRNVSKDSRHFGVVSKDHIEGEAVFRLIPLSKLGIIE